MNSNYTERQYVIQGLFVVTALLLLFKCVDLQLLDTSYRKKANVTGLHEVTLYPSRGLIYDRDTNLLVNNKAIYDIKVTYNQVKNLDTAKFCNLLDIDQATFKENLNKDFKSVRFAQWIPYTFMTKISAEQYAQFQESLYEFPGFYEELRNVRDYNYPVGAHVLGYISEVNPTEIKLSENYYEEGDYIGNTGLEKEYERDLRGKRGKKYLLRDNLGRLEGSFRNGKLDSSAISGTDIISTLDVELQQYGERLMNNKIGSVVAIEPSSGEILSFISSPSYNPAILSINRNRGDAFKQMREDSIKPLFNRALNAQYPPGSTFKTIMSLIGLQEGVINPHKGVTCRGAYFYKSRRFGCRYHAEPIYNLAKALQFSCNTYYYQAFRDVIDKDGYGYEHVKAGMDRFSDYLREFGLGAPLGIDLAGEQNGNIPTSGYYDRLYNKSWKSPTVISLGIGQGELLVTPLQLANVAVILANRGWYYTPHLVKGPRIPDVELSKQTEIKKYELSIDSIHFSPVIDGMELAVSSNTAQIPEVAYCGKTGTVQNPHGEDHSSFIAFAPKENPKIAIMVYVENSGYGSRYARPIASLMIEQYLKGDIDRTNALRVLTEKRMLEASLIGK